MLNTAIVGSGPYGLSVAAHLRHRGISFRIFGRPMDSWLAHMPKGHVAEVRRLRFESFLDPDGKLTLAEVLQRTQELSTATPSSPSGWKPSAEYGLTFQERMVPELEDKMVVSIERSGEGI